MVALHVAHVVWNFKSSNDLLRIKVSQWQLTHASTSSSSSFLTLRFACTIAGTSLTARVWTLNFFAKNGCSSFMCFGIFTAVRSGSLTALSHLAHSDRFPLHKYVEFPKMKFPFLHLVHGLIAPKKITSVTWSNTWCNIEHDIFFANCSNANLHWLNGIFAKLPLKFLLEWPVYFLPK